jgi:hypothetical protein
MQALISLCDGEEDYFEGFFDIHDSSEKSAIELVRVVGFYDLKRKIRSAQVRVDGITHRFDRSELLDGLSEIDVCVTCHGKSHPNCSRHGVAASNARQDAYYRRVGGRD